LAEVDDVLAAVGAWGPRRDDIRAVALVGSWARGTATTTSDVDVVVLTDRVIGYVASADWVADAVGERAAMVRTADWGVLTERRVRLSSGLEVEFGFAPCSWAAVDPVDPGTAAVVRDGCVPLFDPDGLLDRLAAAVRRGA
jgi:predicted nucleotidyltransferase